MECDITDLCLSWKREGKSHTLTPYYSGKMCTAIKITHVFRVCTEAGPQSSERFGVLKGFRAI